MLVSYVQALLEKKMSPFKRKDTLNDGPRGGENAKASKWDCKCKNYKCTCTDDEGNKKSFKIKKGYKKKYNREYKGHMPYKRWRSKVRKDRDG